MRILQACLAYPPNYNGGGAALTAAALTGALLATGHRPIVVAPKLSGAVFTRPRFIGEAKIEGLVKVRFLGTWLQVGFKTINPGAIVLIPRLVVGTDLVIIHGLRTFCGSIAGLCCLLLGKRYAVFPHGMIVPRWRSLTKKYAYDAVLGKRLLRRAEKIVCLSVAEREEAIQATGRDPRDVLTVDAGQLEQRPRILRQPPAWDVARILFLGRLVPEKSIELAIDAIAEQGLRTKYEIWVAGPEESKHYAGCLRERAGRLDVTIHFTGGVYGADKDDLIMESHLLALVSEYESYGRVAMEALQLGTPVLVTNTCGIASELDRRCGLVVNRSVGEIGEALANLCAQDFRELRALRNSCRRYLREDTPGVAEVVDLILRGPRKEMSSQPVSD